MCDFALLFSSNSIFYGFFYVFYESIHLQCYWELEKKKERKRRFLTTAFPRVQGNCFGPLMDHLIAKETLSAVNHHSVGFCWWLPRGVKLTSYEGFKSVSSNEFAAYLSST